MTAAVVARLAALSGEIEKLEKISNRGAEALGALLAPLDYVQKVTATLARNFNEFVLPPLRFATGQVRSLSIATAAYGAEISRAAKVSNLGVERYQELRYAAEQAGVAHQALTEGLAALNRSSESARAGSEGLLRSFSTLGISADELGNLAPDRVFLRVIDALGKLEDPALRAESATVLFGSASSVLARLTEGGSASIEAMAQRARDFGLVLAPEEIDSATSFKNGLDQLDASLNGLALTIGSQLLPVLQPVVDKLTLWISANRELIGTKVEEIIAKIADVIIDTDFDRLFAGMTRMVDGIASLIEALGGWEVAAVTLLGLLSGDAALSSLAAAGGGVAALWNKIGGEPGGLESTQEELAELLDKLRQNREKHKTASSSEQRILDREFETVLQDTQNALQKFENEVDKVPATTYRSIRGVLNNEIPNPKRSAAEQRIREVHHDLDLLSAERSGAFGHPERVPPHERQVGQSASTNTAKIKSELDVYVHVQGEPTRVNVVPRPGSNLDLSVVYTGLRMRW